MTDELDIADMIDEVVFMASIGDRLTEADSEKLDTKITGLVASFEVMEENLFKTAEIRDLLLDTSVRLRKERDNFRDLLKKTLTVLNRAANDLEHNINPLFEDTFNMHPPILMLEEIKDLAADIEKELE